MTRLISSLIIILLLLSVVSSFAQLSRRNQIEIYAGAGFPVAPDEFKDFYKVGLSLNAQYVIFLSPRLGIPISFGVESFQVNNDAISDLFSQFLVGPLYDESNAYLGEITSANIDVKGTATAAKIGIGLRPYLTSSEASTQIFLFGNATYNWLTEKGEFNSASVQLVDIIGNESTVTVPGSFLSEYDYEEKNNKMGAGFGLGIEIPVGSSINLIFQGMYNIIFTQDNETESENTSFVGVTAGIVF